MHMEKQSVGFNLLQVFKLSICFTPNVTTLSKLLSMLFLFSLENKAIEALPGSSQRSSWSANLQASYRQDQTMLGTVQAQDNPAPKTNYIQNK